MKKVCAVFLFLFLETQAWTVVPSPTTKTLYASGTQGRLVVGEGGTILYDNTIFLAKQSADGLTYLVNYQHQVSGTTRDLFAVHCINTCWAVGDSGIALHQVGGNWTTVSTGTNKALRSTYFFYESDSGYAVGDSGTILKKQGSTWNKMTSGVSQNLNWVKFQENYLSGSNPNRYDTGFVVGAGGVILKSTNRGSNWLQQTSGTTQALYSAHFWPNSAVGFVVGAGGTILKTTNRGASWAAIPSGTSTALRSIFFGGPQYTATESGIIVGDMGVMLTTSDGGDSWSPINSGTTKDLYSAFLGGGTGGVVLGKDGTILQANPVVPILPAEKSGNKNIFDDRLFDLRGRKVEKVPEGAKVPRTPLVSPKE